MSVTPKDRKVQFRMSEETYREFKCLADSQGLTLTETLRRALSKEKWFHDTVSKGHKIYVEKGNDRFEVIPI